jgi:MFS transporter, SP family, sugar:H+ symporter
MPCFLEVYGYRDPNPMNPLGWNLTTVVQQLISSLMTIGAFVGSLGAGPMSVYLGRKPCVWIACVLCCASNAIMQGTTSIGALYVGRTLIGISNGFFMTFGQLYIQEVIPARYRGASIASFNVFTSLGALVGTVVDNFTAKMQDKQCYRVPLSVIYAVPAIIFVCLFFIPESPRYLVSKGKFEQARKGLVWLRPTGSNIEAEIHSIEEAARLEKEMSESTGWLDLVRRPLDRKRTMLAVGAVTTQAASGAFFMIAYGTYFFEMAGVGNAFENSCILSGVGVAAILFCVAIMPRFGRRRRFLTTSLIICGFAQLIVALIYTKRNKNNPEMTGKLIVAFSIIYIVAYNGGMSSFAWVVGGELPRQSLRSYTFGAAAGVGFLGAWLAAFTAPYFINPSSLNWGPQVCLFSARFGHC